MGDTQSDDAVLIEIGRQKIRLAAETMEEDIDDFFAAVIEELVLPIMERAAAAGQHSGERFWDDVFSKIAEMVNDLPASDRKLVLRALVSVETYRRFSQLLCGDEGS